uniref:Vacuolar fusion protein MON1 homolog n=1 Tax=Parascaris univalens TaxID=6257 RepID=A0A914ZNT0_PARUN
MLEAEELNNSVSVPGGTPMQENALTPTFTLHQHDPILQVDQESPKEKEEACDEEYLLAELCHREFTVFVLSEAGKPIFASCGHEEQLCSLMALVQTFVMVVASWGDCLMRIRSADLHICFSHRNPLILCVVSRDEFQLNAQVDLVYKQIISTLCRAQLVSVFQKRGPNFDLRLLLRGAERHLNRIVHSFRCETSLFLRCVRVFAMNAVERELIASTIVNCVNNAKISNVIFGLVLAHRQLVAVVRMKGIALHPSDLHILVNLVECNQSFRNADNWIPICLPHFNDTGFVHAFVSYLWEGSPACLMLLSLERGAFQSLREVNTAIAARLLSQKYRAAIQAALEKPPVFELDSTSFPDIWHFVYKNRCSGQTCSAPWRIPYVNENERRRLLWYYKKVVGFSLEAAEVKHLFATTPHNCLMSYITQNFELHCVLSPFVQRQVASAQAERLLKALKKEESRFFITSSLFF